MTDFYELTIFNEIGENARKSLAKGTRVVVVGDAEVEKWTGDNGQERSTKRIIANAIGPDLRWATATVERTKRPHHGLPPKAPKLCSGVRTRKRSRSRHGSGHRERDGCSYRLLALTGPERAQITVAHIRQFPGLAWSVGLACPAHPEGNQAPVRWGVDDAVRCCRHRWR